MESGGSIDFFSGCFNNEVFFKSCEELLGCKPVEVFYNPVIVDNLEVRCRESNSKEVVVLLISLVVGIVFSFLISYERRSCSAVMTVSDIQVRYFFKFLGDFVDGIVIVDYPEMMPESIRCGEVIFRFSGSNFFDDVFKSFIVRECKENRLNVGIVDSHMLHPVLLLVSACKLMFLDALVHIVIHICRNDNAILCATVHCLGVDVVVLFVILHEPAVFLESVEVFNSFVVNFSIMLVGAGFKVDFGLNDMVQRFGVAFRLRACLFRVKHVIRS